MTNVEFAYDYASPWSYLASEILERSLPGVPVTYVPVYLRGFPNFQKGVPESISGRLNYLVADLRRCTARWEVPVSFPANFPLNGLYAVRGALWVQAHAPERFAAWHAAAAVVLLALAFVFYFRQQSRYATFFYAMTAYAALSFAIIKLTRAPEVFVWLSLQSLVVVGTAVLFRSRFIVGMNFERVPAMFALIFEHAFGVRGTFDQQAVRTH